MSRGGMRISSFWCGEQHPSSRRPSSRQSMLMFLALFHGGFWRNLALGARRHLPESGMSTKVIPHLATVANAMLARPHVLSCQSAPSAADLVLSFLGFVSGVGQRYQRHMTWSSLPCHVCLYLPELSTLVLDPCWAPLGHELCCCYSCACGMRVASCPRAAMGFCQSRACGLCIEALMSSAVLVGVAGSVS